VSRNGELVGALQVDETHEMVLISASGTLVRTPVAGVSILSRNTQGVRLIRLGDDDQLCGLDLLQVDDDIAEDGDPADEA
jgi:DNA gyrase subunit A